MNDINIRFRQRIEMSLTERITFDNLDVVLEKVASSIPFENLCILSNRTKEITAEHLIEKILDRNEGGLCYELNSTLHLFLIENGFKATLVKGRTFDHDGNRWSSVGRTHIVNLITYEGQTYIVDTGFGANLPLKPVPLNGEIVESYNGEFRIEKSDTNANEYYLYMKLKHRQEDWKLGYGFDATDEISDFSLLNEVQKLIVEHPESKFNKKPLVTKINEQGISILTNTSYTELSHGKVMKRDIDHATFSSLLQNEFKLHTLE